MPLPSAKTHSPLKVASLRGPEKQVRHFQDIGLIEGAIIELLSVSHGACMLRLKDGRLALDAGSSMLIEVEEAGERL